MHDNSPVPSNAARPMHTAGTDHRICLRVANKRCRDERGDG
jgi:hypothetical protein